MRIKSIEYENFRNFKDRGKITCSTDGRVTIIYGKNGDGKTTFHQLIHWIFYNDVAFNKTTHKKLYHLSYDNPNTVQTITSGKVDFIHEGEFYSLSREWVYLRKGGVLKEDKKSVRLLKK